MLGRKLFAVLFVLFPLVSATAPTDDLEVEEHMLTRRAPIEMENLAKRDVPPGFTQIFGDQKRVSSGGPLISTSDRMARFNNTACAVKCQSTQGCLFFHIYTTDAPYAGVYCKYYSAPLKKSDLDAKTVAVHGADQITMHGGYGYVNNNPLAAIGGSADPILALDGKMVNKFAQKETVKVKSTKKPKMHKHKRHGGHE